jgi:hypothetical protein
MGFSFTRKIKPIVMKGSGMKKPLNFLIVVDQVFRSLMSLVWKKAFKEAAIYRVFAFSCG